MRPTLRLIRLLAALAGLSLCLAMGKWLLSDLHEPGTLMMVLESALWGLLVTLLASTLYDIWKTRQPPPVELVREHSDNVALDRAYPVKLTLRHKLKTATTIDIHDDYPDTFEVEAACAEVRLAPGVITQMMYEVTPRWRGEHHFGRATLLIPGPLGLWQRRWRLGHESSMRVYPNFEILSKLAMIGTNNSREQLGIRQVYRRGEGMEFHQLREFRQGDTMRQIDWKASSRQQKLISREYQEEKDQQIIFMLDASRRMRSMDNEGTLFDHALHAMLILAQVALREGDAVGILSFGAGYRWQKPLKTSKAINTLLNHVYDIYPTSQAPDFAAATRQLLINQSKRSLVILLTNIDAADITELRPAIRALQARHLVMVANLQEPALVSLQRNDVGDLRSALRYCVASELQHDQNEMTRKLQQAGVIAVNTLPATMPHDLVTHYINVKRSQRL
jgi:uncharacterized protein (DUF58 family)